ncbi:DUF3231 family protein [Marinicrinis lubricantis]|uniref:DUF3231 family protein n=1 Tax=Marinicrinis lubricantis TaxID=2086470 RepID=A0ABW1IMZ4_9BACL
MTNIFEAVSGIFQTLNAPEPKPSMHVGEVMDVWKYLGLIEEIIVFEQIGRNMTTDKDLLELLDEAIKMCSAQSDRLKMLMETEGIPQPDLPEDKPRSEANAVPMGVKLTDTEIANILSAKLLVTVMECARNMTECVRNDIGAMWANFFYEQAKLGARAKTMMRKNGWLKIPPAYSPPWCTRSLTIPGELIVIFVKAENRKLILALYFTICELAFIFENLHLHMGHVFLYLSHGSVVSEVFVKYYRV